MESKNVRVRFHLVLLCFPTDFLFHCNMARAKTGRLGVTVAPPAAEAANAALEAGHVNGLEKISFGSTGTLHYARNA